MSSGGNIYILHKKDLEVKVLQVPPAAKLASEQNGKKEEDGENIVCLVFSSNGRYLAAATQDKRLALWDVLTWSLLKEELLVKRPMALFFTPDSSRIIIADKNGDVYSVPVSEDDLVKGSPCPRHEPCSDEESGPEPLLGHLSMLLDMVITDDGQFLITSDRDEKIRVSCFANCYNIHTFCLGHTEFVSHLRLMPQWKDTFLSGSGDGKVKLWNYLSGECLATLDIRLQVQAINPHYIEAPRSDSAEEKEHAYSTFISQMRIYSSSKSPILAISLYKLPLVLLYTIQNCDQFFFLLSFETASPILDFMFLEEGEILTYLGLESDGASPSPVALFKLSEDMTSIIEIKDDPVLKFGKDYHHKLKGADTWSLDASALYKHKYDNMADYQKKKQQRLESAQATLSVKRKLSK